MCQYSAVDGNATNWHTIHLGHLALSGAGLLMIEATAVNPIGRITYGDLGMYSDDNERNLKTVLDACRTYSSIPIGMQISHAGRKGSAKLPWHGGGPLTPGDNAWISVAPSPLPRDKDWPIPHELQRSELLAIQQDFINAATRADRIGIDLIELHIAHGYLLHEFFSPLSNMRTDEYGGTPQNRMRFPLEVAAAVRNVWPDGKPMSARITGSDWVEGGITPQDAAELARALKAIGVDCVSVSSGGVMRDSGIPFGPNYQTKFSEEVRTSSGLPTITVGLIESPHQAEAILEHGRADMVALARGFLDDPRWVWHAAEQLGEKVPYPPQYERSDPSVWRGAQYRDLPDDSGTI